MPTPTEVQRPRRPRRFTPLGLALGVAAGFLAGVLLVAILGGAKPAIRETTVTVERPVTVESQPRVATATVPDLVGLPLDEALDRLQAAGLDVDVNGGGLFGIVDESAWAVTAQDPIGGTEVEQGETVTLDVDRR
ncbi:MAG: PASTA domain-containing protein [Solirubrobacterales bacterium]|nr:PASTA domain-containing protein [Solirubrobacterales bacterium]